jgi:hypothetical protein
MCGVMRVQRAMELLDGDNAGPAPAIVAVAALDPAPSVAVNAPSAQSVIASCMQGSSRIDISGKYVQQLLSRDN